MALREALIAAALRLVEAGGEEPSLRAVARAAGVSAMAPYNHFPDKAGLMAAVAHRGFEMLRDDLASADDRSDPREALVAQGVAFVAFARGNPALFRLMYGESYGGTEPRAVWETYRILAERVADIVPPELVAPATLACRSLVQGMAAIALSGRLAPSDEEDFAAAVRLLVSGFGAGGTRPSREARLAGEPSDAVP